MILLSEIFPAGRIGKPHGTKGELVFNAKSALIVNEEVEFLIVEIDGIFVPFFITEIKAGSGNGGRLKFDGINSEEDARMFAGLPFFLPIKFMEQAEITEVEPDYFAGFILFDQKAGKVGCITGIDQSTANTLFIVQAGEKEILIPVAEDFITGIDHKAKTIFTNLPDGLLEL